MHWKIKAKIQNTIAMLPSELSYATYYWIQRHVGGLRKINPVGVLTGAIETCQLICKQDRSLQDKVFLEVGTGRMVIVPIAYWLMGARKIYTIDLNPYLKSELVEESLKYIFNNQEEVRNLFDSLLVEERFEKLSEVFNNSSRFSMQEILELCCIDYIAPGDARSTQLPDKVVDFHTSYTVFEHIPKEILQEILVEGCRIIKNNGLFVHKIDYSDHFSHSDHHISAINFLQYSDKQWDEYAENQYMYMNRMRHDDFVCLYKSSGHCIIKTQTNIDKSLQVLLTNKNFKLNGLFKSKSKDVLSITDSWIISSSKISKQ